MIKCKRLRGKSERGLLHCELEKSMQWFQSKLVKRLVSGVRLTAQPPITTSAGTRGKKLSKPCNEVDA